ncbi:MAG: succinyl-diaminopimelate desuccinylase [Acidimicrobiales bacterium]|nr:succinyl-diaminopimelate desuccinylase [Acidimicrobiales bacterium]RZV47611.1 MAG: succinyl-diaminopimelate desuccinylase [Acidimicrobiales bacterium]
MVHHLLHLTAELVDMPSVSFEEGPIADWFEAELRQIDGLDVTRVGDNLVARTNLDRQYRVAIGGHLDTVPVNNNATAIIQGNVLHGLGSADMKGGLAVMLELARMVREPAIDVTYVFYAREEVALQYNGLRELFAEVPELLAADVAILGEPTNAVIEAGCQGTMRFKVTLRGERAHTARPWMGRNAVHRLGVLLSALEMYDHRKPMIDGCEFKEAMQAVYVEGGVAGNVVPDSAVVTINHRFAPDRTPEEAEAFARSVVQPFMEEGDGFEVTDMSPAAKPDLRHPLMAAFIGRNDISVRAKLGWTDVAFFAEKGIPAVNFGPGEPTLAHTQQENLHETPLVMTYMALEQLLKTGV